MTTGKVTRWTEERLTKLYQHYNRKFWQDRLPDCSVSVCSHDDHVGMASIKSRQICVNIGRMDHDKDVRSTILHEMAHIAVGICRVPHGGKFWAQIEMLLRSKAPIIIGGPEVPGHSFFGNVIPRKFPLCRKLMNRIEVKRQRKFDIETKKKTYEVREVTNDEIVRDFEDAAIFSGLTWKEAIFTVGAEYGLVDVDGNPKNRWSEKILLSAKKAHRRGREFYLQNSRLKIQIMPCGIDC